MAILQVSERYQEQSGSQTVNGSNYVRSFYVQTDSPDEGVSRIISATGIPEIGSAYPGESGIWLTERSAAPIDNERLYWIVTCVYSNEGSDGGRPNQTDSSDPQFLKPVISFSTVKYVFNSRTAYNLTYDSDTMEVVIPAGEVRGTPTRAVTNSAGEYFSTGIEMIKANLVININRNQRTFDANLVANYIDTINQYTLIIGGITVYGAQGAMRSITATPRWDNLGRKFWAVQYEIEVDRTFHQLRMPDSGFNTRNELGELVPIQNSEQEDITEAVPLDGNGQPANPNAPGFKQVQLPFNPYWPLDWRPLNLPKKA